MKKLIYYLLCIFILFISYGLYISTREISVIQNKKTKNHPLFWDYRGITHVVTDSTRGSLKPKEILLEAAKAHVDFLFLTDLNQFNGDFNIQGYHGNIFTVTTFKVSYLDSHILIYSPLPEFSFPSLINAQTELTDIFSQTDISEKPFLSVLAHPFKKGYHWAGSFPKNLNGIEVLNLRKLWQEIWETDKFHFLHSMLLYPFNPKLSLVRLLKSPDKELKLWDFLNKESPKLGFLGNETTGRIFNFAGVLFSFPKYAESFEMASNHLMLDSELTGNEERDRVKIFSALKKGQFYFAIDWLGDPKGFTSFLQSNKEIYPMGSKVSFQPGMELIVELPSGISVPFEIQIFKDGELFFQSTQKLTRVKVDGTGNFRVVVNVRPGLPFPEEGKWISWIYTNVFSIEG